MLFPDLPDLPDFLDRKKMLNLPDHTQALNYGGALCWLKTTCEMLAREIGLYQANSSDPFCRRSLEEALFIHDRKREEFRPYQYALRADKSPLHFWGDAA